MAGNYIDKWNANGQEYDIQDAGRGLPLGVATLDNNGRIPYEQLPESAVEFKGYWNASTNTPHLADGSGVKGDLYYVDVAGQQNLGSGVQYFNVGDRVLYDGTIWKNINSTAVKSVNGVLPDAQGNVDLRQSIFSFMFPVGTIYQNVSNATNPATLFGFGTWVQITDAYLACRGSILGASGGSWGYVLTEANIPQHNHGGSTGGATANISNNRTLGSQAIITSATHDHKHGAVTTTYYMVGEGSVYSGLALTSGQLRDGSSNLVGVALGGPVNDGGVYDPNVLITQSDHAHVIDQANHTHTISSYGSASPTAISITPTFIGTYTWYRTA